MVDDDDDHDKEDDANKEDNNAITLAEGQQSLSVHNRGKDNCGASVETAAMAAIVVTVTAATTKKETW